MLKLINKRAKQPVPLSLTKYLCLQLWVLRFYITPGKRVFCCAYRHQITLQLQKKEKKDVHKIKEEQQQQQQPSEWWVRSNFAILSNLRDSSSSRPQDIQLKILPAISCFKCSVCCRCRPLALQSRDTMRPVRVDSVRLARRQSGAGLSDWVGGSWRSAGSTRSGSR